MNREDVAMDVTVQNVEILRGRLEQAEYLLRDTVDALRLGRGFGWEDAAADRIVDFLASQQGEQCISDTGSCGVGGYCAECPSKHPEQAEAAQGELDERMRAAGMFTVAEMLKGTPLDAFTKHAGVCDMDTFGQWLEMKRAEYLKMQARYDLGERDKSDDLYEWVIAHLAVFTEAHVNFRAALAQPSPAPELERPEVVTHSDDAAVDRFSASMKQKLEAARAKGRSGWDDPSSCDVAFLAERLIEHLGKGNAGTFEDVANFAMMLHQRGAHPQVLAEAAGAIERDYLRIIQAQEEKWSGRFEVLEDEAKTLRRERDAAQARVAELEKQEPEFWYRDDGDGGVEFTSPCDGFARPLYAAPVAQAGQVPEGYALMPKTLTAENGAKGIFLGEFREHAKIRCQCIDSDGDADDYCELCHGDGSYLQPVAVRWETIKAIYATAVDKLAAAPQPAKGE